MEWDILGNSCNDSGITKETKWNKMSFKNILEWIKISLLRKNSFFSSPGKPNLKEIKNIFLHNQPLAT